MAWLFFSLNEYLGRFAEPRALANLVLILVLAYAGFKVLRVRRAAFVAVLVAVFAFLYWLAANLGSTTLGFVFRGADRWYDRHEMTDLGGCSISNEASAFDCGDLGTDESKTYSFRGIANVAGTFHFELALRELVHPFDFVNDHSDGADAHVWDETVN